MIIPIILKDKKITSNYMNIQDEELRRVCSWLVSPKLDDFKSTFNNDIETVIKKNSNSIYLLPCFYLTAYQCFILYIINFINEWQIIKVNVDHIKYK